MTIISINIIIIMNLIILQTFPKVLKPPNI